MDKKNVKAGDPVNTVSGFMRRYKIPFHQGVVVAVSGGPDSTVLAHAMAQLLPHRTLLAHCQFGLRQDASEQDLQFVERLGGALGLPVRTVRFDTMAEASASKESVQMTARRLRYEWLEKIRKADGYGFIATAHHADDVAETVLQHIIDGTGLAGLTGVPPVNGRIIRPLLSLTKAALLEFAKNRKIGFRIDQSNLENAYTRNKIRLELIPKLKEFNPSIVETLSANAERWRQAFLIYNDASARLKRNLVEPNNGYSQINIASLLSQRAPETVLFEILSHIGFNTAQSAGVFAALESEAGKLFFSDSHRLVKDRSHLIITPVHAATFYHIVERGSGTFALPHGKLAFDIVDNHPNITFDSARYEFLDADKLRFPLLLRPWKKGDYLYPLGLNKKKKVSDVFVNKKLSVVEKERQPVLLSGGHVAALPGLLIDHRFRVTTTTRNILRIQKANSKQ